MSYGLSLIEPVKVLSAFWAEGNFVFWLCEKSSEAFLNPIIGLSAHESIWNYA